MGRGKRPALDSQGRKRCPACRVYKKLSEYSPQAGKPFNVNPWCKVCVAQKKHAGYTLENARAYHLLATYGVTVEEYERLLAEQQGVCACCGLPETRRVGRSKRSASIPLLHIDHCHETGTIRGLLCSACNQALGLLKEDPQRIKGLLRYVEERVVSNIPGDTPPEQAE